MSRTYREFGELLNAYNNADNKWTPIQNAYRLIDSLNENEVWKERQDAANALFKYISELVAERDQAKAMVNQLIEAGNCLDIGLDYAWSLYGYETLGEQDKWHKLVKDWKEEASDD